MPTRSAIAPCKTGIIAPPTIAMIMIPEPSQVSGPHRANAKQSSSAHLLQESGTNETSNHGAAPVKGNKAGRNLFRESPNLRLGKVVHQETSDGNLSAHVNKNADRAKD